jgi:hypothetical protein
MSQSNQEYMARRFKSFDAAKTLGAAPDRFVPGYDTVLPEAVRVELGAAPRGEPEEVIIGRRPLGQPPPEIAPPRIKRPSPKWLELLGGVLAFGAMLAILAVLVAVMPRKPDPAFRRTIEAIEREGSRAINSSPGAAGSPAPGLETTPAPRAPRVTKHVPRAKLVHPPAPRADGLEPLQIGSFYPVKMPYGLEVRARYHGELPSIADLPTHPNQIGDMYLVGNVPWIWLFAPGATRAAWIDP